MMRKLTIQDIIDFCKSRARDYRRGPKNTDPAPTAGDMSKEAYEDLLAYIERWM